jgi:hypothetical protein
MSESTIDMVIQIADYWEAHAPEKDLTEWSYRAYLDELSSWAPERLERELKDIKGEL